MQFYLILTLYLCSLNFNKLDANSSKTTLDNRNYINSCAINRSCQEFYQITQCNSKKSTLKVKFVDIGAVYPKRHTPLSAGLDLYSIEAGTIASGERKLVNTGIAIGLPEGTYGQIAARSSMALKGIDVGAGVFDADSTATIKVLLINNSKQDYVYYVHDRIAQLVVHKIAFPEPVEVEFLEKTVRGDKGFGSSGR